MRSLKWTLLALLAAALSAGAAEKAFKPYPGATRYQPPETEQNKQFSETLRPGTTITAYLTEDSLDKVAAFYRAIGKEYVPPRAPSATALPRGEHLKKIFLILDGAPDLLKSLEWISIQRPFVGSVTVKDGKPEYHDIRNLTEIVLTEREPQKKQEGEAQKPGAKTRVQVE